METSLSIVNDMGIYYVLEQTENDKRILRVATHEDLHTIKFHPRLSVATMVPLSILLKK